ncbi:MAG: amidohydrolase family protein [Thermoanaerobaculia bacterium]
MKRFLALAAVLAAALALPALGETPLADHHQHLLSPASAKLANDPPLPAVELPDDLGRLFRAMEKGWNDKQALAPLFTADSVVLDSRDPHWIKGHDEVTTFLSGLFARPYRVTPVSYGIEGSSGHVAAYLTRGEGAATKHFGQALFSVRKGTDGTWRIAAETPTFPGPTVREPRSADDLIAQLDEAGIRRAAVLSTAYWFGSPLMRKAEGDEYANVRAENDWTAGQAARYPGRLVVFCSFNPLKDYALQEIDRCAQIPQVKGLKLHFGNSGVDVRSPEHVEKLRKVFAAANGHHLAIVAHLWTLDKRYGREDAQIFLDKLLPAAPDVPVQIAHFAGGGPGYTDQALAVYADAIAANDPRTKNLYFDVATVADEQSAEVLKTFARRIRQIGLHRVLFGTDLGPPMPRQSWLIFRTTVPLTDDEFRTIAGNVAPYFR